MRRDYSMSLGLASVHPRLDLVQLLFCISAVLAPLDLELAASFTAYDLVIAIIASLLIFTGPRGLCFPPASVVAASCFFLLFALLSAFRATYPVEALTQALQFGFIFFLQLPVIFTVVRSLSVLRSSLILFIGGMWISVLWSMLSGEVQGAHRALAFYSENPNRLGYPTAYLLPFVLYFLIDNWKKKRSWLGLALSLLVIYSMIWALMASGSRSAAIGTLIALIVFLSFRRGLELNVGLSLRIVVVLVMLAIVSYGVYQTDYFPTNLQKRIESTLSFEESVIEDRKRLALAGWQAFLESPFIGVGLDNFRYVATRYDVPSVTEQVPHNLWLQFLAQIGLPGTLAFLFLIVWWYLRLFRAQRTCSSSSQRELLWAFISSMTAIMGIFMFAPLIINRHYWLFYGLGLTAAYLTPMPSKRIVMQSKRN